MARHTAERAQRREAWLGTVVLFLFGCGVLAFLVGKDRVDWLSGDHARTTLTKVAGKISDDLGHTVGSAFSR